MSLCFWHGQINPVSCATEVLPKIWKVYFKMARCGGSRNRHPSCVLMSKSILLKGSAVLALLGTRNMWGVIRCLLCQAQCEPMRLFMGWCSPVPLMMASLAASLSQSWMYCDVSSGLRRIGAIMAARLPENRWRRCYGRTGGGVGVILVHEAQGSGMIEVRREMQPSSWKPNSEVQVAGLVRGRRCECVGRLVCRMHLWSYKVRMAKRPTLPKSWVAVKEHFPASLLAVSGVNRSTWWQSGSINDPVLVLELGQVIRHHLSDILWRSLPGDPKTVRGSIYKADSWT